MEAGITTIWKEEEEGRIVGFLITNSLEGNPYLQLDYLATFPQEQDKGYGSKAIHLLKEEAKGYAGIFAEMEKVGLGKNEKENEIRKRRAKFYQQAGFIELPFDLNLYFVVYSAMLLPTTEAEISAEQVKTEIFKIYTAIMGEKATKKRCIVLEKKE